MRSIFVSISLLFSFSIQMSGQPILFSDTKTTKSGIRCVAEFQRSVILPVPLKNVHITDSFWLPKLQIYKDQTIPHSWNYLNSVIEGPKDSQKTDQIPPWVGKNGMKLTFTNIWRQ